MNPQDRTVGDYYQGDRPEVMVHVPPGAQRVLDVGCGAGNLGRALKERGVPRVEGLEINPEAARLARDRLDAVHQGDVASMPLPFAPGAFDVMICADVLEHLVDPGAALARLRPALAGHGRIIASIPNVRYFGLLNHLVEGGWTYADQGILDRTHLRFFTIREMVALFQGAGFRLLDVFENLHPDYESQQPAAYPADFTHKRMVLRQLSDFEFRDLFVFQYILICAKA
ncbi:MAG: methyltransferase domain-containing protein [Magnetococcales bacterium]|nr:methyltransferase domain-containing protein [Magnetococcales bacterium]